MATNEPRVGTNFPTVEWTNFENSVNPQWIGDFLDRESLLPGGAMVDPAQFNASDAVIVTSPAGAAQGATAIPVSALSGRIPSGTLLSFGAGKYAKLTAEAAAGAVSLAVEALPVAIPAGSSSAYAGTTGRRTVASGTLVGRTFAERATNAAFGPADVNTPDDEAYLVVFDVVDADQDPQCELYRHGRLVKENFLPGWSTASANYKALIRKLYTTTIGA